MKIIQAFAPDSSEATTPVTAEELADKEVLEAIMSRAVAKKGRSDAATVAQLVELESQAYFAGRLPALNGTISRLEEKRAKFKQEAGRIQGDLEKLGKSSTRHTLALPKEWMERLTIVGTIALGLTIVSFDWSSTMEFLLPMTDNRRIALFGCGLIFTLPILEALYFLKATEERRDRTMARQWPLTLVFGTFWVVAMLTYGNQSRASIFSSSAGWVEFLPVIRMTLQILTASLAAGVAFLIAIGTFLRLPAVSTEYVAVQVTLQNALDAASRAEQEAEPYRGKIESIQAQLKTIGHKTLGRLENLARIEAELGLEKSKATDGLND